MAVLLGSFVLLLVFGSSSAYILFEDDPEASIVWPSDYYFEGEELEVVNGRVKPFEVWHSGDSNRTRVDYFGGNYKQYYYAETDDDPGYVYTIHSITSMSLEVSKTCRRKSKKGKEPKFLPSIEGYKKDGVEVINEIKAQKWTLQKTMDGKHLDSTIYFYRSENNYDVPIKTITKIHDVESGSLLKFVLISYHNFKFHINEADVSIDNEATCEDLGTLGNHFKTDIDFLNPSVPEHLDIAFDGYKRHHKKKYNEMNEHELRKSIFYDNWRFVEDHNRKNLGFTLELNEFADWTDEEYAMLTGTKPSEADAEGTLPFPHEELMATADELPESFDMRFQGFLRPISHQGSCGSCWAFATTAAVEGALARRNGGKVLDLSEQSLVDCAWGYENGGCSGGQLDRAFRYITDNGIPTEADYGPYLDQEGVCHIENVTATGIIQGYAKVTEENPTALKAALYKYGPVSVAVTALRSMKLYSSGIFYDMNCEVIDSVNHGVTVVGYGVRDGVEYWIVRNSWGETWGEGGYMLMSTKNNNCHLMTSAYYPVPW